MPRCDTPGMRGMVRLMNARANESSSVFGAHFPKERRRHCKINNSDVGDRTISRIFIRHRTESIGHRAAEIETRRFQRCATGQREDGTNIIESKSSLSPVSSIMLIVQRSTMSCATSVFPNDISSRN